MHGCDGLCAAGLRRLPLRLDKLYEECALCMYINGCDGLCGAGLR